MTIIKTPECYIVLILTTGSAVCNMTFFYRGSCSFILVYAGTGNYRSVDGLCNEFETSAKHRRHGCIWKYPE